VIRKADGFCGEDETLTKEEDGHYFKQD